MISSINGKGDRFMKKKVLSNLYGKLVAGFLAIALIITGALFMKEDGSDVLLSNYYKRFHSRKSRGQSSELSRYN